MSHSSVSPRAQILKLLKTKLATFVIFPDEKKVLLARNKEAALVYSYI